MTQTENKQIKAIRVRLALREEEAITWTEMVLSIIAILMEGYKVR